MIFSPPPGGRAAGDGLDATPPAPAQNSQLELPMNTTLKAYRRLIRHRHRLTWFAQGLRFVGSVIFFIRSLT